MKFERLSNNELQKLEKEFIQFLVVNGIVATDWEKIKIDDPEKAEKLIALFSDMVWEKSLEKIKFLEHRTPTSIKVFNCKKEKIELIGVDADHKAFSSKDIVFDPKKNTVFFNIKKNTAQTEKLNYIK